MQKCYIIGIVRKLDLTTSHVATFYLITKRGHPFYLSFTGKAMIRTMNDLKTQVFSFSHKAKFWTPTAFVILKESPHPFSQEIIFYKDYWKIWMWTRDFMVRRNSSRALSSSRVFVEAIPNLVVMNPESKILRHPTLHKRLALLLGWLSSGGHIGMDLPKISAYKHGSALFPW